MSELAKTIDRLELWVEYWEPHQIPELIADVRTLIGAAKAVSRAVDWLQKAQRYDLACYPTGAVLERCTHGDYIDADDVKAAIDILQDGQQ